MKYVIRLAYGIPADRTGSAHRDVAQSWKEHLKCRDVPIPLEPVYKKVVSFFIIWLGTRGWSRLCMVVDLSIFWLHSRRIPKGALLYEYPRPNAGNL